MKLTRRGLLAALGVAPAAAKVEAGVREQPKTKAVKTRDGLWLARGREMDVVSSRTFQTAFWGDPGCGKTEAGLMFLLLGPDAVYANYPEYRGLVVLPSHMAADEWMRRAKGAYLDTGAGYTYSHNRVRFPSGAQITAVAGVGDYMERLRGCVFQQVVFDGSVPEDKIDYTRMLYNCRDHHRVLPARVLLTARPWEVTGWADEMFGRKDRVTDDGLTTIVSS